MSLFIQLGITKMNKSSNFSSKLLGVALHLAL